MFGKIKFDYIRPPPYQRKVWHFKKAKVDLILRSVRAYNWERSFRGLGVDQQVEILTDTLLNIFNNFIPNEIITCKSKDPPWMTKEIKSSLRRKNRLYKKYISRGMTEQDMSILDEYSLLCESLISESKNLYISNLAKKINDPLTSPKAYW